VKAQSPPARKWVSTSSRYWDQHKDEVLTGAELRFEASREVPKEVLVTLVREALGKSTFKPTCTVVDPGQGEQVTSSIGAAAPLRVDETQPALSADNRKYVLVGRHLLSLYKVYAPPSTVRLLADAGQQQEARPFPTVAQAKWANNELFPSAQPQPTETALSEGKRRAVVGEARSVQQGPVMNNKSATLVCLVPSDLVNAAHITFS
jgi:hypothetical protein